MANKLVLVPETFYKGLLASNEYADRTNIEHTKSNLEGIKRSRKLNASAKNVLYNQELRRYLSMREDEKNKPVKVEVANGGKFLTKPNRRQRPSIGFDDDGEEGSIVSFPTVSSERSPMRRPRRRSSQASSQASVPEEFFNPAAGAAGNVQPQEPDQLGTPQAIRLTGEEHDLYQYLVDHGERFGVTAEGRVISSMTTGRYVQNADLRAIVRALKNPEGHPQKPPGYKQVLDRGKHDALFRVHVNLTPAVNPRTHVTTRRVKDEVKFSPNVWRTPGR
jgi:hypothetical protein